MYIREQSMINNEKEEEKMKILLISASDVECDGRLRELIELLKKIGSVHVLASGNIKDEFIWYYEFDNKMNNYLSFVKRCVDVAKTQGLFDVVFADNRKAILPAIWIKKRKLARIAVQDVRELYLYKDVNHLQGKIGCIIEKLFNNKFDINICANEMRAIMMQKVFNIRKDVLVFENIRELKYSKCISLEELETKYGVFFSDNKFNIISTAGCSLGRGTEKVVKAVTDLGNDYMLYLVGKNNEEEERYIRSIGGENVIILPQMKEEELKYCISKSNLGVVIYNMNDMNNKYCASGKIYEFIFEGIPVITSENPPLQKICSEFKIGIASNDYFSSITEIKEKYSYYRNNVKILQNQVSVQENISIFSKELENKIKELLS